jgi:hypothetical protein
MSFFGKLTYFGLTVINSALMLFLIWYSFKVYAIVEVNSIASLLILCVLLFFVLILYLMLQGFVYRAADYVTIKENNYYNKLYLGDNEIE